jgi:hypothetical protein
MHSRAQITALTAALVLLTSSLAYAQSGKVVSVMCFINGRYVWLDRTSCPPTWVLYSFQLRETVLAFVT